MKPRKAGRQCISVAVTVAVPYAAAVVIDADVAAEFAIVVVGPVPSAAAPAAVPVVGPVDSAVPVDRGSIIAADSTNPGRWMESSTS